MIPPTNLADKEWAIIVHALGRGDQILLLRKGSIHEAHGCFQVQHPTFWLFPAQFHEAEQSVIPNQPGRFCAKLPHSPRWMR